MNAVRLSAPDPVPSPGWAPSAAAIWAKLGTVDAKLDTLLRELREGLAAHERALKDQGADIKELDGWHDEFNARLESLIMGMAAGDS